MLGLGCISETHGVKQALREERNVGVPTVG